MRVLVTGATGLVGSAVVTELLGTGHQVVGVVRTAEAAAALEKLGAEAFVGDIEQPEALAARARDTDGVIHTAFKHDFTDREGTAAIDLRLITAFGRALDGTGKPLVVSSPSGGMPHGDKPFATEEDSLPETHPRISGQAETRVWAGRGVRAIIVRLPNSVHGPGDKSGFVPGLVRLARKNGRSAYLGAGENRWAAVHVTDAARVYRLALENAPAGATLHAIAEPGVRTRDIALAIADSLGVDAVSTDDRAYFGVGLPFIGVDSPTDSARTRELLSWEPTGPTLLEDIASGVYLNL